MPAVTRRRFLAASLASGLLTRSPLPVRLFQPLCANNAIGLGFISCGGRATGLMGQFAQLENVRITGLCDPDAERLGKAAEQYPGAKTSEDLRELLEWPEIDAVVIATCNHWHCLAAIYAMQAGKDVYVEKPLSHSQWEGERTVAVARSTRRICQLGTQQRSDPMQADIKAFLHDDKALGEILATRINRFGVRAAIGRRDIPLPIPGSVNYDLWLGPAASEPLYRDKLQYDWHWDWNTGSGEMGNWCIHMIDDVRNVVLRDSIGLPRAIHSGGARIVWEDAGNTPNVQWAWFETGTTPVMIAISNLPDSPDGTEPAGGHGPPCGYVVYCEGGEYHGQRAAGVAFDQSGAKVREFSGNGGELVHQQNFIDAVRARDASLLNSELESGNHSTGWCNLANIAMRQAREDVDSLAAIEIPQWTAMVGDLEQHVGRYGLSLNGNGFRSSEILKIDADSGRFTSDNAAALNHFLKREYRKGWEIPV